jgi:hypothetical protein
MKVLKLIFCLFPFYLCIGQLSFPYSQNFESEDFLNDVNIDLDVNGPEPLPREDVNIMYGRGYSWEIINSPIKKDNSLKLTVHPNDNNKKAEYPRSRSEVTFKVKNSEPIYISYYLFFPNNEEYNTPLDSNSYHIFHQFKENYWDPHSKKNYNLNAYNKEGELVNVSDILGVMQLLPPTINSIKRDIEFWCNDYDNIRLHALGEISTEEYIKRRIRLKISNAIEMGIWNEIIVKINFSNNSDEGFYSFWINRKPVVIDSLGNLNYNEYFSSLKNSKEEPSKLFSANIIYTTDKNPQPIPLLVKLGHYRQNIDFDQSIFIDNFRIWNRFPVEVSTSINHTEIIAEQCNKKMGEELILYAYDDPHASQYTFRFRNLKNNKIKVIEASGPALDLRNTRLLKGKKNYEVEVKTSKEYSSSCHIYSLNSNN